jgi:hypothetical protein
MPGAVSLTATGNIVLNSGISTTGASNVTLTSNGGDISMAGGTRLDSRGGDIQIGAAHAQTVAISTINARSGDLSVSGVVNLDAGGGTITDANHSSAPDIFAKAVSFTGYGPATGSGAAVLGVVAEVVQVNAPQGLVVRDTGADGRTYFNVMSGGHLYQQLVVEGAVTRVTEDPATLLQKDDAALIAAGLPLNSSLLQSPVAVQSLASSISPFQTAPAFATSMAVSRYLATPSVNDALISMIDLGAMNAVGSTTDLLSDNSYGIASRLQQSYILGTPGEQPFISGLDTFSQDTFEYWIDNLSL